MAESKFNLQDVNALFKIKYEKLSENVYNSANVLLGRVKKSYNFTGRKLQITVPQSFSGGVGSGSLPKANAAKYSAAEIEAKKVYAVVDIDRETIKASLSSEGAFVQATKEVVKKGVESFMRNMSRILFNDGSGSLGSVADLATDLSGAGSDASPYVLTIADMKEANFEEKDLVQIDSETTDPLEIIEVDPDNSQIKLVGSSAILATGTATNVKIHMQGSKDNDPDGLKGVIQKSDGRSSSYGIAHGRRWESVVVDQKTLNAGVAQDLTTDMLNEVMLKVKKKCGKSPNLIVCSYKQYEKLLNLLESTKQFTVPTRANLKSKSGADISFSGISFVDRDWETLFLNF